MKGLRIAVIGMGRSGIAIAKAAQKRGAIPIVFDEKPADSAEKLEQVDELGTLNIECACGWHGHLDPAEHDLLVTSPGIRRGHPAIQDALRGNLEVISEVEFAYRIAVSPILAITGTNGKSTTTVMTWQILTALGHDAVLCGNISGSGYSELTLTEAADMARPDQPLVAEISSFQLEWVSEFRPLVATITNITPDHLDRHPNFEDYYATKLRIFGAAAGNLEVPSSPSSSGSLHSPLLPPEGREVSHSETGTSLPRGRRGSVSETNSGEEGLSGGEGNSSSEILSAGGEAVNASEQGEVVLVAGSYTSPPHLSSQAHRSSPPAERNFASTAVVNTDEPSLPLTPGPFADVISNSNLVKFGPCEDISFTADAIHYFDQTIETKDLPFNENYNLANATQALAIVHAFSGHGVAPGTSNVDLQRAKLGLQAFKKLNFRMQEIGEKDGILVINNSMCTNPMAVVNSSQGLTRKQILLIGGLTKNLDFTPVKTYLKNSEHSAILFGPNPDQLRGMIGENLPWFESMDDAFRHAISSASAGNAIVLAPGCASAFPYANFRERGEAFERIAKEWLTNSLTDSG